ncbi:D-beta-hydroxybutyrate dehydrogenase, mitochondrial, partial [Chelonus insularis]|uniref:D-beta-hydroxybutyrate dehydrogenase, mitochondrial n=1 Tax=Chelonus insularis TaxID=460826 RepID=UPI0015887969
MQSFIQLFSSYFKKVYLNVAVFITMIFCAWKFEYISLSTISLLLVVEFVWFYFFKNPRRELKNKDSIIVTGCDTGLGYSLALHCSNHLNISVIAAVHNIDSLGSKNLSKAGITVYPLEITDSTSVKAFVQLAADYLKRENLALRGVVNNVGAMIFGEFEWQTEEQIRHQMEVNLLGTMRLTKEMLPVLREQSSRLIIVTSHCSSEPLPGVAIYSATKAGLFAWATSLRVELKKYGVEVVSFVPGSFIRESNLLSQQRKHFEVMKLAMTQEARSFYSDYFERYADYLSPLSRNVSPPQKIENPRLYEIFEDALLDQYPQAVYKCEPWRYMIYFCLFKITSMRIRDWLVERFVQMPAWKDTKDKK